MTSAFNLQTFFISTALIYFFEIILCGLPAQITAHYYYVYDEQDNNQHMSLYTEERFDQNQIVEGPLPGMPVDLWYWSMEITYIQARKLALDYREDVCPQNIPDFLLYFRMTGCFSPVCRINEYPG